jgi:hypothetical protein
MSSAGSLMDVKHTSYFTFGKAKTNSGLKREGYCIWGGAVIKGEDGKYHMFASSWPDIEGYSNWVLHSEIVHAIADTPEGPFTYHAVALPARGEGYWDGSMTHNPTIQKHGDTYILFYTGTHYAETPDRKADHWAAWNKKRIGIATSKSVYGPWQRYDSPILEPREGKWDEVITSNPAPYVHEDGSVILVYKSTDALHRKRTPGRYDLKLGVAKAAHYLGPYERIRDDYIFPDTFDYDIEDPYIWRQDGIYHMIAKLFEDGMQIIGENRAGCHATSPDGIHWTMLEKGYSRTIEFKGDSSVTYHRAERAQLLIEEGVPKYLYLAVLSTNVGHKGVNICIPIINSNG